MFHFTNLKILFYNSNYFLTYKSVSKFGVSQFVIPSNLKLPNRLNGKIKFLGLKKFLLIPVEASLTPRSDDFLIRSKVRYTKKDY